MGFIGMDGFGALADGVLASGSASGTRLVIWRILALDIILDLRQYPSRADR